MKGTRPRWGAIGLLAVAIPVWLWLLVAERSPDLERCLSVPSGKTEAISSGLTITGGGTLRHVKAVESADYASVYFVSADLQGPGLNGTGDIATWATNRLYEESMVFAVDGMAKEFSDWGSNPELSLGDDGVRTSASCSRSVG